MEDLELSPAGEARPTSGTVDAEHWRGRRVLVTGHTGFKGSWLSLWLARMGANVVGMSDAVPTNPSLFDAAQVAQDVDDLRVDVRDHQAVLDAVTAARPEVVFHMAAQSLVRPSFERPRETYEVNVMGTVNLLEAVRRAGGVRVVVIVTSDKCYANREWEWGYRESDAMGGHDPYSSSKGCVELVTEAFRRSYFGAVGGTRLASARAGNVIGGGDWATDRLVPDFMRGALASTPIPVRNPDAIRPWQHVLNPVSGYLVLAEVLWRSSEHACAWNFGPAEEDVRPVRWIAERIAGRWTPPLEWVVDPGGHPAETNFLKLDSSRARSRLGWRPRWNLEEGLDAMIDWYEALRDGDDMRSVTLGQIEAFQRVAAPTRAESRCSASPASGGTREAEPAVAHHPPGSTTPS